MADAPIGAGVGVDVVTRQMLTVYTAVIGETDEVQAPAQTDPSVRYLCFSDRACVPPYVWIRVPTVPDGSLPSRRFKVLADHPALLWTETLWHDASYRLIGTLDWVHRALRTHPLITLRHPKRSRLLDEGQAIARYGYVTPQEATMLVDQYHVEGFQEDGLSSGGLIGRRPSDVVQDFNAIWWAEVQRWRGRDQASLDYAAWRAGVSMGHVPGTVRDNAYALWRHPVAA